MEPLLITWWMAGVAVGTGLAKPEGTSKSTQSCMHACMHKVTQLNVPIAVPDSGDTSPNGDRCSSCQHNLGLWVSEHDWHQHSLNTYPLSSYRNPHNGHSLIVFSLWGFHPTKAQTRVNNVRSMGPLLNLLLTNSLILRPTLQCLIKNIQGRGPHLGDPGSTQKDGWRNRTLVSTGPVFPNISPFLKRKACERSTTAVSSSRNCRETRRLRFNHRLFSSTEGSNTRWPEPW